MLPVLPQFSPSAGCSHEPGIAQDRAQASDLAHVGADARPLLRGAESRWITNPELVFKLVR